MTRNFRELYDSLSPEIRSRIEDRVQAVLEGVPATDGWRDDDH